MTVPCGTPFQIGDIVWSKVVKDDDGQPKRGMITGILVRPTGCIYYVTWCDDHESLHYAIELTEQEPEKSFLN